MAEELAACGGGQMLTAARCAGACHARQVAPGHSLCCASQLVGELEVFQGRLRWMLVLAAHAASPVRRL